LIEGSNHEGEIEDTTKKKKKSIRFSRRTKNMKSKHRSGSPIPGLCPGEDA
jgi:hypothetical protein